MTLSDNKYYSNYTIIFMLILVAHMKQKSWVQFL